MRALLFLTSCVLLCGLPSLATRHSSPAASPWRLAWSDEFNQPNGSSPDPAKWTYDLGGSGWGNHELESYTARPENARIENGNLIITAREENFIGADGVARNYTSARLKTQSHFDQAYGRFEARIKIPSAQGTWPAFWLLGDDIAKAGWPRCGEIDIMENIGREPAINHGSLHGPVNDHTSTVPTADLTGTFVLPIGQSFADDFHLYAVEWEPDSIRFFVDSTNYATFTRSQWPASGQWVFDHPFFIILNLAIGGTWPGSPDSTTQFPQQMLVDYVRVYTRN